MKQRIAKVERRTRETEIELRLNLDGSGKASLETGIGFFDHMLHLFAHHAQVDLVLKVRGDLHVDEHHSVEDAGLVLGQAFREALGERRGIERYGWSVVPMDEVLVAAAVDFSGRPGFVTDYSPRRERVGELATELVPHFFQSWTNEAKATLHLKVLTAGDNEHHRIEALFKAWARAVKAAVARNGGPDGEIPSTKGVL
ncbi:MAG: imidazoleglycerol-phosphate dehydratase HisB [Acidobacteriota bacterium]